MAEINSLTVPIKVELSGNDKVEKEVSKLTDTLTKSVERVISTFEEFSKLLEDIGNKLRATSSEKITLLGLDFDVLKDKTGSLRELSAAIENFKEALVKPNENAIKTLADLINGISELIVQVNNIVPLFVEYESLILGVGTALFTLVGAIGAVAAGVKALGVAFGIGAGPIGLIVLALTGIITVTILIIRHWEDIKEIASKVWTAIGEIFESVVNFIKGLWDGLIKFLEEKVPLAKGIFDAIRSDAEDTRAKNEALFKSINENQKNNPPIGGFQQLTKPDKATQEATEQAKQQTTALGGLATANREAEKDIKKTNEALAQNGAANQAASGGVAGNASALRDYGNTAGSTINPIEQLNDGLRDQIKELQFQIDAVGKSGDELLELEAKQKLADGASADLVARWKELEKALDVAKKQEEFVGSIEDLIESTKEERETLGLTGEELREYKIRALEAKLSTQEFTEEGLKKAQEELANLRAETEKLNTAELAKKFEDLQFSLLPESDQERIKLQETLDFLNEFAEKRTDLEQEIADVRVQVTEEANEKIQELERKEYIERLKESGSFIDGIKAGFLEFVDQVENNSELVSQFFADTLSQMSQNFSDLFFNIITGKFKDLADLAKQAFEAILRAFLDLVSAIATRQIVISIAGLFGVDTKGASAGDVLGLGKDAVGGVGDIIGGIGGLFGGGGAAATNTAAIGSSLGLSLSGSSAASTFGASLGSSAAGVMTPAAQAGTFFTPAMQAAIEGTGPLIESGGGILATISTAATVVGAVLAAAALAFTIIAPLLEKTPRLDIDFDSVKTEAGRRAALVSELLDDDFLKDEIIDISVKRKAGLGLGGDEGIKDVLADAIQDAVNNLLDIINKLPTDLADTLTDELLNTPLDTETEVAGERLFEFDAKGKKIGEKFNQFINGEIQAKFLFAVDGFLQTMFESLGVLPEAAESFLDKRFEEFKNAGSREARAKVGQELLADINAFVDAFNIVSGNVNDAIGQTIQSINSLSSELGFEAVPSIGELTDKLGELLENAELDPETVQKYADLRNAIVQGISDIINSITGLIGKISQLNSTIVSLGGSAVNVIPFLDEAQAKLIDFYTTNLSNLSLGEQEMFLDELLGIANAKLAEEQAAFQRAQEARQKAEEAQRARIEKRIDNLNKEKDKINEVFNKRIEALNEELRIAEDFASLTESIRQTLDSILFSPESVLTGVEQVSALQSNIATLQAQLASTTDPEKQLDVAGRLEEAFKTLFDMAGDAFGVNSPEFVAIFDQVTGGLENLAEFTEGRGRSVEEISAEIERLTAENEATLKSIDAKIEATQERLANIGQSTADNTFHASQELTELFEFIRSEYMRILEERFAQLGEVSEFGFATEVEGLGVIAGLADESLTVLKGMGEEAASQTAYLSDIAKKLGALAGFQHGSEGLRDFGRGTLAVLHGLEAVITKRDVEAMEQALIGQFASGLSIGSSLSQFHAAQGEESPGHGRRMLLGGGNFIPDIPVNMTGPGTGEPVNHVTEMSVDINVNVNGGSQASIASLAGEIENMMVRSIRQGRVRKELQEAAVRRVA